MQAKNPVCRTWFLQLDFSKIKYRSIGGRNLYQPQHFCIFLFCQISLKTSWKSKLFNVKVVEVEIVHFGYGLKSQGLQCLSAFFEKEIEVASLVQGLLLATGQSSFLECTPEQGINLGPGKVVKKNKHREMNKRRAWRKCIKLCYKKTHQNWKYL